MRQSWVVAVLALCACNNGVSVTRIEPGAECPTGGVRIASGSTTELVCNGTNGTNGTNGADGVNGMNGPAGTNGMNGTNVANWTNGTNGSNGTSTLLSQTPLALDDPRCPRGGVLVSAGPDSGGDGGVANDGVLQPGEVTSEQAVCTGDDGARVGSFAPPAGPPGAFTIKANGGAGSSSTGGGGGVFAISAGSTNGGHIKLWSTGVADASVDPPPPSAAVTGATPLQVTTNTVIAYADPGTLDAGAFFVRPGGILSLALADGGSVPVSSLHVSQGASLSVAAASVHVRGPCVIDGQISRAAAGSSNNLRVDCFDLRLSPTSVIDLTSLPTSASLQLRGDFVAARGTIDVSGRSGASPHAAGSVTINARRVFTEGTIQARGVDAMTSALSQPGSVTLTAETHLNNAASIDVSAGKLLGPQGDPPHGGTIVLEAPTTRSSGTIVMHGGDATAACVDCYGACGGSATFRANSLALNATILGRGGASPGGEGGCGGTVRLHTMATAGDSIFVSGNFDLSGSDGISGGGGGRLEVVRSNVVPGAEIAFLGAQFQARGGSGWPAGQGGVLEASFDGTSTGGAVLVTATTDLRGGDASAALDGGSTGGRGGRIILSTRSPARDWERVVLQGPAQAIGGGGAIGGSGGAIHLTGGAGVSVGAVTLTGSAGSTGASGQGGSLQLVSSGGVAHWTGPIDLSAAPVGATPTDWGGLCVVTAQTVRIEHPIRGRGTPGALVRIQSLSRPTSIAVPAPQGIDVSSGGQVMIDAVDVTANWTH